MARWKSEKSDLRDRGSLNLCGLRCDGSLFWAAPVEEGENVPVPLDADGRLWQPCACFSGACTIYADRPAASRKFDCRVLQTVQAGRRDMTWARDRMPALRVALPGRDLSTYRPAALFLARHQKDLRDPAFQREHRELLKCLSNEEAALARFHVAETKK